MIHMSIGATLIECYLYNGPITVVGNVRIGIQNSILELHD